eukprot:TRINITY_DN25158_c0_g1_i1.p1 TRINITY_DN25158_c0_g1~~TRINITY_DN25158_c0_g1_i1.p1  ORF type:complete len:265 (+),score=36.45 TRINITY_DN25158_c0_g1_i1:466-1260(+)
MGCSTSHGMRSAAGDEHPGVHANSRGQEAWGAPRGSVKVLIHRSRKTVHDVICACTAKMRKIRKKGRKKRKNDAVPDKVDHTPDREKNAASPLDRATCEAAMPAKTSTKCFEECSLSMPDSPPCLLRMAAAPTSSPRLHGLKRANMLLPPPENEGCVRVKSLRHMLPSGQWSSLIAEAKCSERREHRHLSFSEDGSITGQTSRGDELRGIWGKDGIVQWTETCDWGTLKIEAARNFRCGRNEEIQGAIAGSDGTHGRIHLFAPG